MTRIATILNSKQLELFHPEPSKPEITEEQANEMAKNIAIKNGLDGTQAAELARMMAFRQIRENYIIR